MNETAPNGKPPILDQGNKPIGHSVPGKSLNPSPNAGNEDASDESLDIGEQLALFLHRIEALNTTLPRLMVMMQAASESADKKLRLFLRTKCKSVGRTSGEDEEEFQIPSEFFRESSSRTAEVSKAKAANRIVPETFVMALLSQYDAFVGRLLRCSYLKKPELLNDSDKEMTYGAIIGFNSIEEAKDYIIEKEIEGVLRKSHAEQFTWMENQQFPLIQLRKCC